MLLDLLAGDPEFGPASREAVRGARREGKLIACDVVWAETGAAFDTPDAARSALETLRVEYSPVDAVAALSASQAWRTYRRAGGARERVIADFLIAAHASAHADRLLTRDRGLYRAHFEGLTILDPSR